MKYLITYGDPVSKQLSEIFIPELERFDIRNEIVVFDASKRKAFSALKKEKPDLLIVFGDRSSFRLIKHAKQKGFKTCFFHQTFLDSSETQSIEQSTDHKVYLDTPGNKKTDGDHGNLLMDLLRKTDRVHSNESLTVSIVSVDDGKWLFKLKESLSTKMPNVDFRIVIVSSDLNRAAVDIQKSNAVIATDSFSEVMSALCNSPLVRVYRKRILSRYSNRNSEIDSILGKHVVKSFSAKQVADISQHLNHILEDYNYCARLLQEYQQLKSIIGTQPFARKTAQEIVDWLENDND